jgi:ATP-dependent Clp protease ATP-binding subunit ClpA
MEERLQKLLTKSKPPRVQLIVLLSKFTAFTRTERPALEFPFADDIKPVLARGSLPALVHERGRVLGNISKKMRVSASVYAVWIEEPTIEEAMTIVQNVAESHLAEHHQVTVTPEAVETAVKLSARHLHDERLPGKAIKVLDQACSSLIVGGSLSGEPLDDLRTVKGHLVTKESVWP